MKGRRAPALVKSAGKQEVASSGARILEQPFGGRNRQ